ncbi:hypothetical protein D3C78_1745480 [compost metagenome]
MHQVLSVFKRNTVCSQGVDSKPATLTHEWFMDEHFTSSYAQHGHVGSRIDTFGERFCELVIHGFEK